MSGAGLACCVCADQVSKDLHPLIEAEPDASVWQCCLDRVAEPLKIHAHASPISLVL